MFDFSGYPVDSKYYDNSNKKGLRKMKDELNGVKIIEFVGLKCKMYSLIAKNDKEVREFKKFDKTKGANLKLRHKEYIDVLFNKNVVRHKIKRTQINLHKIVTYDINKISLSCSDHKRHVLNDGINTLAFFHKEIKRIQKY